MAVEDIANITKHSQDPLFPRTQDKPATARTLGSGTIENSAIREDRFTPSTQNNFDGATAQEAGIFRLSQNAAAGTNASIPAATQTASANQGEPSAQTANAAGDPGTARQAAGTVSAGGQQGAATVPETQAAAGAAASVDVQAKLQALNAALPALGLTNAQILQIDRIAALVHNFNPAAYANLVNEYEAQAQQAVQQSAANPAPGAPVTALPKTNPGGAQFQVQDIVIHFTGTQRPLNNAASAGGGQGTDGNSAPGAPAPLKVEQVQFTFVDGNGQTFQLSTPQRSATTATNLPAAQARPAVA
jgi:hypothetical protein